jgi:hypothetical protein
MLRTESHVRFRILITDFCSTGLPEEAVQYLKQNIGSSVIVNDALSAYSLAGTPELNEISVADIEVPPNLSNLDKHFKFEKSKGGKGRSTGTGLPHILELYDTLTHSGDDFTMSVHTGQGGTTFRIAFMSVITTPVSEIPKSTSFNISVQGIKFNKYLHYVFIQ